MGRPRRGTEATRNEHLITIATQLFLKHGFDEASIDNVAKTAGVSSRTIYERFKTKANLLAAVVYRLIERHTPIVPGSAELDRMSPARALYAMGMAMAARMCDPDAYALFRIVTTEALRFPQLAAKARHASKAGVEAALTEYFRRQTALGILAIPDPQVAASRFMQMICSSLHEKLLFGLTDDIANLDFAAHVSDVVEYFLHGLLVPAPPRVKTDCTTLDSQIWST